MINPFVICSVAEQAALQAYADRERWECQCRALGASLEQARAYDANARAYAATTLYSNDDVVAYARRLALDALMRGEGMPADVAHVIEAENARVLAALLR